MTLRDQILAADDLPREPVDVPWELGGAKLYVRGLTADEKDGWVASMSPGGEFAWQKGTTARLVCMTLVDEHGDRVLEDADAVALGAKSAEIITELYTVAARLSGLSEEDVEADFTQGQDEPSITG